MKILIIQPKKGMGDMIIYLPYIHAISKKFNSVVSILAKDNSRANELLAEDSHIDEIIPLTNEMDGFKGILKLTSELKKRNFKKVFIFSSSLRYNLVARLSCIKSIYQYPLFQSKDNIVHSAKIFTESIIDKIVSTEPKLEIKKKTYSLNKEFKNICLGISASGPTKRWNIKNYIRLADQLSNKFKCKFYLAGGKQDIDLIKEFKNSTIGKNSISFEKSKISETLGNISDCDLYIGNDTGWAHISVALGVKSLTIFCDSPVLAYGRYSKLMFTVEPEGEKDTTTHDTLGKDKISFNQVIKMAFKLLN